MGHKFLAAAWASDGFEAKNRAASQGIQVASSGWEGEADSRQNSASGQNAVLLTRNFTSVKFILDFQNLLCVIQTTICGYLLQERALHTRFCLFPSITASNYSNTDKGIKQQQTHQKRSNPELDLRTHKSLHLRTLIKEPHKGACSSAKPKAASNKQAHDPGMHPIICQNTRSRYVPPAIHIFKKDHLNIEPYT